MTNIIINTVRTWEFKIPRAIRYMNTNFIEDFFEFGKIMLTTYEKCRKHEDAIRCDLKEGSNQFNLVNGNIGTAGIHTVGAHSYMLCGSIVESTDLMNHFSTDNYLIINDILGFADAISRYIPGFLNGKFGNCIYKDERLFESKTQKPIMPDPKKLLAITRDGNPGDIDQEFHRMNNELYENINRELANETYFVKEKLFSKELEFRVIWSTSCKTSEPLHIKCPEAIKFCTHGKPLSRTINPPKIEGDGQMSIISGLTEPPTL